METIIQHQHAMVEWGASLMELDDTLWQTPLKPGKWNIGETLAHLIAWDEFLLDHRLREIGSAESMSPAPEVDAFNHEAVTRMEKASKAELFRQFTETKLRIIEEIKELNADYIMTIGEKDISIGRYFLGLMEHDLHHKEQIDAFLSDGLTIQRTEGDEAAKSISEKLYSFNLKHFPEDLKGRYEEITLTLSDATGEIRGGLVGEICWNWMEVKILMVDESLRGGGHGSRLLQEAERIASVRGCDFIKLDTLSFQARGFYEKHGYDVFGTLENVGRDHSHFYMKKDL